MLQWVVYLMYTVHGHCKVNCDITLVTLFRAQLGASTVAPSVLSATLQSASCAWQ